MGQTLAKRIGAGFFVVVVIFLISFLNTLYNTKNIEDDIHMINSLRVPTSNLSSSLLNIFNRSVADFQAWVFTQTKGETNLNKFSKEINSHLVRLEKISDDWTNPMNQARLQQVRSKILSYNREKEAIKKLLSDDREMAKKNFTAKILPIVEEVRVILKSMVLDQKNLLESDVERINAKASTMKMVLYVSVFICLLLASFLGFSTTRSISTPIGKINQFASGVTRGNLNQILEIRGIKEFVSLGQILTHMQTSIRELTEGLEYEKNKLQKEDWIKTNYTNIFNKLQGINSHEKLADTLLSELTPAIKSPLAVFYLREDILKVEGEGLSTDLLLVSSYAYKKRKGLSNRYKLGEGIIGQCARERKIIQINKIPNDYLFIESGLGEGKPQSILALPIMLEDEIMGVLEMATLIEFTDESYKLLEQVAQNVGIIIAGIASKNRTEQLLKRSQEMAEELQQQQEELKAANEELEAQTQALKQSEEELKQQSEELQSTNEELEEKTEYLERQKREIEESKKSIEHSKTEVEKKARELQIAGKYKSEFLANMSHELRTPLNSLLLLSKFLMENKQGNLTSEQIEDIKVIHGGGTDLLNLINDILDLSKVESGKMALDIRWIEVESILEDIKKQFVPVSKQKSVAFKITLPGHIKTAKISTDSFRVQQILKNFLSNAFKFTDQGYVELKVEAIGEDIKFSVIDTGIGIPENMKEEIFKAFQQGDGSTSRKFGGTGLGLTISREMSKLLNGKVSLEKSTSEGSIFSLKIPIKFKQEEKNENSLTFPEIVEPRSAESKTYIEDDRDLLQSTDKSMLIVEDDPNFAKILLKMLRNKGYRGIVTKSGVEALSLVKKFKPSAILLDLGLPDMEGLRVLEQLKENSKTRHIPVHVISGQGESAASLQKGAIGHLMKPIDAEAFDKVFSKIETILSSEIKEVLVVEDDDIQRKMIEKLFDKSNINLSFVSDGLSALDKLQSFVFDCMILDLNLKGMQGQELLKKLREDGNIKIPPIVINTSRDLTVEEERELKSLANRIVVKGVHSSERLLDEVSLFLHTMESNFPGNPKDLLKNRYEPEKLLDGKCVLVVDDDMRNTFALSKVLKDIGLNVVLADNGKIAIEKLIESGKKIDAVIMDVMMPVMDGYEATKEIRKIDKYKNIPIIALTAKAMPEDRQKCIEVGCNDYLTKPVDIDKLVSLLKVWIFNDEESREEVA